MTTKAYGGTVHTGGGTGALDRPELNGNILEDLDLALINTAGTLYPYWLDEDSGLSPDSPNVIPPSTNPRIKNWILQGLRVADIQADNIQIDGNVGIGMVIPNNRLHIFGSGDQRMEIESTDGFVSLKLNGGLDADSWQLIADFPNAGTFGIHETGTINRITVKKGGAVGIGTDAPSGFLSVTPLQYNTGLARQEATTITGQSGATFTSDMVGSQFVFKDGTNAGTITGFISSTSLAVSVSQSLSVRAYRISYTGLQVSGNGLVGINTSTPTEKLDINGDGIRIRTPQTPASAGATGTQGQIAWDSDYLYTCIATDTWKRSALSTW